MNIIERLEKSGLLALPGSVDDVLNTVVNNLIATGNLGIEAKCRVLLTTPLETFSVGQTIVISRGLLDVLPDEASLATVLAAELAHIALGHRNDTHFAFYDRTMLPDEELLNRLQLARPPEQIASAAEKTFAMLAQSPYKEKMGNAGLFLKALASRAPAYPEPDPRESRKSDRQRRRPGAPAVPGGSRPGLGREEARPDCRPAARLAHSA